MAPRGFDVGQVGLNFSAAELRNPDFCDQLTFDVDRAELQPTNVAIELLETALIEGPDDPVLETINALSQRGFTIDLDDFGTGHSSLSNLQLLKIDRLKIDRAFVSNVHAEPERRKMAEAMIRLADTLNIEALAEGVETGEEHAMLCELGCHALQGFGIGRPMPKADVIAWIEAYYQRLDQGQVIAA